MNVKTRDYPDYFFLPEITDNKCKLRREIQNRTHVRDPGKEPLRGGKNTNNWKTKVILKIYIISWKGAN